ncbi:MAG: TIGR01777 family protein [Ignavibacteriae bacterium]|nr:TIGR01777 family protein [Ignavibacteriota bacterium]
MKMILSGCTGFIGSALTQRLLDDGHTVILLTRKQFVGRDSSRPRNEMGELKFALHTIYWDGKTIGDWSKHIDGADAVINLAGELIAGKRWSVEQKKRILESRINSTRALVQAMKEAKEKPKVFISASAVGYYGSVEEGDVTETHPKGEGFLADVCAQWETESHDAMKFGVRVVNPRLGVVLGNNGGALPKLLLPFKFGFGGWLGNGRQWFPWIHRDDVINAIVFVLVSEQVNGAVNFVAPELVNLKDFCHVLGEVIGRPSWMPVPTFVLRVALGEMSEMLLTGQNVVPHKFQVLDFKFRYPSLHEALVAILSSRKHR